MSELATVLLADAQSVLTAVYWGAMIIGGGLLLVSMLGAAGGGADVDAHAAIGLDLHADTDVDLDAAAADVDVDFASAADVAHAAGGGAAALTTWFSMRFVVFFAAVFGAVGVILTHLTRTGTWTGLAIALLVGLIVGQGVHQVFRQIRRTSGDSTPRPEDYVNKLARVTVAVVPPNKGEVALQVRGSQRFVPAVGGEAERGFAPGEEVVVVAYCAGVAQVVSRAAFEQRLSSAKGGSR